MLLFLLVAGHQKILTVTLSKNILFKNVFEACDRGEYILRFFLKLKMKRNTQNNFSSIVYIKNRFAHNVKTIIFTIFTKKFLYGEICHFMELNS